VCDLGGKLPIQSSHLYEGLTECPEIVIPVPVAERFRAGLMASEDLRRPVLSLVVMIVFRSGWIGRLATAGTGLGAFQRQPCLQGGLLPSAVLRDQTQLPDLRSGGTDRPPAREGRIRTGCRPRSSGPCWKLAVRSTVRGQPAAMDHPGPHSNRADGQRFGAIK